jgi:hypothetical protein
LGATHGAAVAEKLQNGKGAFQQLLAPGSWLLAPGSLLLAPGSWLLAPGSLLRFLWQIEKQDTENQIDGQKLHTLKPVRLAVTVDLKN